MQSKTSKTKQEELLRLKLQEEERALERGGSLHWFHWLVLAFSLVLTISVWQYSSHQIKEKIENQFDRQGTQIVALIKERLQKYEDALWSGVATIHSHNGEISFNNWKSFAEALDIEEKYQGINGIGVIHHVPQQGLDQFLQEQRVERPSFNIHPEHSESLYLPISYIIPVATNAAAVGLDAALNSRDSGKAQITGPIILVQDSQRTPGFLFYAPYYQQESTDIASRKANFEGLVYAPFVVANLMRGTLARSNRTIHFRILDQQETLYDESQGTNLANGEQNHQPRLSGSHSLSLYGRNWVVETWDSRSFWNDFSEAQPKIILACGILLDVMLLTLFLLLSRAQRNSLKFAKRMVAHANSKTDELRTTVTQLQRSNEELEQFAYIASHDLQEPLRTVSNFSELLKEELSEHEKSDVQAAVHFMGEATTRMQNLLVGLMNYSRISRDITWKKVDCNEIVDQVESDISGLIQEKHAKITTSKLPVVVVGRSQLHQLFQNLISNALKFSRNDVACVINISVTETEDEWTFSVADNGIGIAPEHFQRIFQIFRRLHRNEEISGSGIGLSSCKKIVTLFGGEIWLESTEGEGSCFYFTIPKNPIRN